MKTNFVDSLDTALERLQNGEEVTAVLQSYPQPSERPGSLAVFCQYAA